MNSPILSICIPTFNNSEILSQNIHSLTNSIKGLEDKVEILVSENFISSAQTEKLLKLQSNVVKVFTNSQNLGFSKNLLISLSLAKGKYLMLLGDDDFVDTVLISDLLNYLSISPTLSLLFLPLHNTKYASKVISPAFAFMRSGAMPGIIFNVESLNLSNMRTDNSIYSQVELAMDVFFQYGAKYINSDGCIRVGEGLPLEQRFSDKMSRPIDYGILERFSILLRLKYRYSMRLKDYSICYLSLLRWGNQIFFRLIKSKPIIALKFASQNFYKNPDKFFFIALQSYLLLLTIKVFISKCSFFRRKFFFH